MDYGTFSRRWVTDPLFHIVVRGYALCTGTRVRDVLYHGVSTHPDETSLRLCRRCRRAWRAQTAADLVVAEAQR